MNKKRKIIHYVCVSSTNDVAKRSELDEAVFTADEQTSGRGSNGRGWQSNRGQGLYMSFLLRPDIKPHEVQGMTLMAAVVVCRAIEKAEGIKAGIKWPNDILIDGRKVCGILTESKLGPGSIERIVCGVGVNTNQSFDSDLYRKACSLDIADTSRKEELRDDIIDSFFKAYEIFKEEGLAAFIDEFRKRSALNGTIRIISGRETVYGEYAGFDDTGAIIIKTQDGVKRFVAGEVTVRGESGYA